MSDKLVEDDDVSVDETKQQAIAKHYSDMKVMSNLINAIDSYLIVTGKHHHLLLIYLTLVILLNKCIRSKLFAILTSMILR